MRPLTQLLFVVLLAYTANSQNSGFREDFLKRMQGRANPFSTRQAMSTVSRTADPSVPSMPGQGPTSMPTDKRMMAKGKGRMLADDGFNDGSFDGGNLQSQRERDEAIREQDRQRVAEEAERRLDMENSRKEAEEERKAAEAERMDTFRQRQQELEERLRDQAASLEEQRLQREDAEKERNAAQQEKLESQRQALEEHRMQMETHRMEMEEAQKQRDEEVMDRFRENQLAQEERLKDQEAGQREQENRLREQEASQREFEQNQKDTEKEQREMDMNRDFDEEDSVGRMVLPEKKKVVEITQKIVQVWKSCESDSCMNEGRCINVKGGDFKCDCKPEFTGSKCEVNMKNPMAKLKSVSLNMCEENACQNSGLCKLTKTGFECTCNRPYVGELCDQIWENPCNEVNLRSADISQFQDPWNESNYIICTDINIYHTMPCSIGTIFNEAIGHCVFRGYNPVICPRGHCKNDAECIMDENEEFKCVCKLGFTGEFCESNIDECAVGGGNEACNGGKCVDQLNGFYCECSNGQVGLNCEETIQNPCTKEVIESHREFFIVPCIEGRTYLHCTSENKFVVNKCAEGLFWDQEERACVLDRPLVKTGKCSAFPCQNGDCQDVDGTEFKCVCKKGYEGDFCETMLDSCASNPCQNGGRCLPYAGGYTCACHDKIIDECCCHGIKNPCPSRSMIIPGVNNYFPHLFTNRYIHCDFEGRAFSRKCSDGLKWHQSTLSCLPQNNFTHFTEVPVTKTPETSRFLKEQERQADLEERQEKLMEKTRLKTLRFLRHPITKSV